MSTSKQITLHAFGQTDIGLVREKNEDALLVDEENNIYAVADGLGGLPGGDLASKLAINTLEELALEIGHTEDMQSIFRAINSRIYETGFTKYPRKGIGTTLTAVYLQGHTLNVAHCGDTGAILLKPDGSWERLTKDHTMAQDMLDKLPADKRADIPEIYYHSLTLCMGQYTSISPQFSKYTLHPKDRVLLYSDGASKSMNQDEILEINKRSRTPKSFVEKVIKKAKEYGAPDNVTAIAIFAE